MTDVTHNATDYPYVDQTKEPVGEGITAKTSALIEEASQDQLNPAFAVGASQPAPVEEPVEEPADEEPADEPVEDEDAEEA